ncbi:hypothetical protein Lser_V15G40915 [Lactuca serriola]
MIFDVCIPEKVMREPKDTTTTSHPQVFETITTNPEVTFSVPTSVPITYELFQDSTLPSPTTTTITPITIAPCPPVSIEASQPEISTAHTTPLFMESTAATTTTTTTSTPPITVNVSDMGERAYGFSSGVDITPISPLCQDDPDTIFGDGRDIFEDFTYSPFRVQQESDEDDAPMTTEQFKAINTMLGSLLESTKAYSSNEYSQASVKAFLETLTKEHASNLALTNKTVTDSKKTCKETTEKVDKIYFDIKSFMEDFRSSSECNTTSANTTINSLISSLQSEKDALTNIMDELAFKTKRVKVLSVKLTHANSQIVDLKSENVVIRSYVVDVNANLHSLIKTRNSLLTVSVRQHHVEKLQHFFSMLDIIQGVSKFSIPTQGGEAQKEVKKVSTKDVMKPVGGGDDQEQKPKLNESKVNVTLNSRGKQKLIDDSDVEEEDENEKLRRKICHTKIDENLHIVREVEEKERLAHEAQLSLEAQKIIFPIYSMERILNEAIDIQTFIVANVPFTDKGADQMLFSVNLKHMKPQYETWSSKKIIVVKVSGPIETESFPKAHFKEVRKMDVQIATVLRKKPTVLPKEALENLDKMKLDRIRKDGWCMDFQIRES